MSGRALVEGTGQRVIDRSGLSTRDIEVASTAVSDHAETLLARSRSLYPRTWDADPEGTQAKPIDSGERQQ